LTLSREPREDGRFAKCCSAGRRAIVFNDNGTLKNDAKGVPWFQEGLVGGSLLKNRWIKVRHKEPVVYAQWEDVGPFGEADFDYVVGCASVPKNRINNNAGSTSRPRAGSHSSSTTTISRSGAS
jgi:hypothetical protein